MSYCAALTPDEARVTLNGYTPEAGGPIEKDRILVGMHKLVFLRMSLDEGEGTESGLGCNVVKSAQLVVIYINNDTVRTFP
jgi:hypothetical protein